VYGHATVVFKNAGDAYKKLSPVEKLKWEVLARKEKERYAREMEAFGFPITEQGKKDT